MIVLSSSHGASNTSTARTINTNQVPLWNGTASRLVKQRSPTSDTSLRVHLCTHQSVWILMQYIILVKTVGLHTAGKKIISPSEGENNVAGTICPGQTEKQTSLLRTPDAPPKLIYWCINLRISIAFLLYKPFLSQNFEQASPQEALLFPIFTAGGFMSHHTLTCSQL